MIDNSQPPKISFCITCKNRLYQIKKTLPQNLEDNRRLQEIVEFVLVDFGSTDGLRKWISDNFKHEIRSGYLKYFYTEEMVYWHASIAKNTAHMLAQNDILVNLDCDNYTGSNGGWFCTNVLMMVLTVHLDVYQLSGMIFYPLEDIMKV